ncbi:50S ribosomal protein L3 [Rickettsiales bacterium]|nr:50S ribosomal protein L3 [Rickettsiales bacterium]
MLELAGKKIGMSHFFDKNDKMIPLTFIELHDTAIVDVSKIDKSGNSLTLVAYNKANKDKNIPKNLLGLLKKKKIGNYKKTFGYQTEKSPEYKTGDIINQFDFIKEGDKVAVTGVSIGKGFAGAMKRHGFGGLEASHGVSISHRSHGSTGQCQDPGKVFKGKKMAGHMGASKITVKNLEVVVLDQEKKVIAVKGAVPGSKKSDVFIKVNY